jgi:hypothetical protein
MATNYRFATASYSVEEVSDLFCTVLDLTRLKPLSPTPIVGPAWWAGISENDAEEFNEVGRRLESVGRYTSIAFVPDKRLLWEDETRGLVRIITAVVDLLSRAPDSSGFLEFYDEVIVLEKRRNQEIVVDPRLLDPDDLDDQRAFAPILKMFPVEPIEQL